MAKCCTSFKIDGQSIGNGAPCYIIAEAGSNHNRNIDIAFKLIDVAVEARVNAVKFQTFSADTIASQADIPLTKINYAGAKSPHELFKKLELPRSWQKDLFDYASSKNVIFLSTPFDEAAVEELFKIGIEAYKIASFELNHFQLLRCVAQTGKPVLLSTGMATLGEIEEALAVLDAAGCKEIGLFHCGIGYPMKFEDVNLRAMDTMAKSFGYPVGYSDHTLGIAVPIAAVARGAQMIEKHFTLGRTLTGPDHAFALEPNELADMAKSIRAVEFALGSSLKCPVESEFEYKARGRRSLFAKVPINQGTIIKENMLAVLRPAAGLHPRFIDVIVGRRSTRNIQQHEPITWDCI